MGDSRPASSFLESGKIPVGLLAELLAGLPAPPPELRLGPGVGEDACAVEVGGEVLVVASDPVTLTAGEAGFLSVVVNANDVAVTGARPRWFLAVVLVPPGATDAEVRGLFADIGRALIQVGAHLVGGHTEVTSAVTRPVVVGQMLGVAEGGRVVSTGGACSGDVLVQVGPAPVEGALLAREAAARLAGLEPAVLARRGLRPTVPGSQLSSPRFWRHGWERRRCTTRPRAASPLASTSSRAPRGCGSASSVRPCSGSSPASPPAGRQAPTPGPPLLREPCWPPSRHRSPPTQSGRSRPRAPPLPSSAASRLGQACATWTAKGSHGLNETRWYASPHGAQLPLSTSNRADRRVRGSASKHRLARLAGRARCVVWSSWASREHYERWFASPPCENMFREIAQLLEDEPELRVYHVVDAVR